MAKDKPGKSVGVKKVEDKYVCDECFTEVPVHQDCPACKKHIDWDRALQNIDRYK